MGSVSIQAWGLACAAVILLTSDAIKAVVALARESRSQPAAKVPKQPMSFGGTNDASEKIAAGAPRKYL